MSDDKKGWCGPFGMNVADIIILALSSLLILFVAVQMLMDCLPSGRAARSSADRAKTTPVASRGARHR